MVFILACIAILSTTPYVFKQFLPLPSDISIIILSLGLFVCLAIYNHRLKPLPGAFNLCVIIQFISWLLYVIIHDDTSYVTRIIFLIFTYLIILLLSNSIGIKEFIRKNNLWITIQAVLGLFAFLLILIGVLHPFFTFQNVDGRAAYCYGLTCSNVAFGNFIRSAGYFDEPGALACWGVYALVLNKLYIKDRRIEIALIIGLLSTFSTAYYIQLFVYLLFYKIKTNIKSLILLLTVGVIGLFVYNQGPENDIYKLIYGRINVNDYGEVETNRDDLTNAAKDLYRLSPIWGNGARTIEKKGEYIADNPYETLAVDGIIGTIVIYLPLIILVVLNLRRIDVLKGIIIIALGYLQRPFHLVLLHYIMLFSFLYLGVINARKISLGSKSAIK